MNPIQKKAKEWTEQLESCQFVGELIVQEEELKQLSKFFNREAIYRAQRKEALVLTVMAVNCAYYYYNDAGFWVHYCDLLGVKHDNKAMSTLGGLIEDTLYEWDFISRRRSGPFRYVGAILEQSGLPVFYIPAFRMFLAGLDASFGWANLSDYSDDRLISSVENSLCPKWLKHFLADQAGMDFLRQIVKLLFLFHGGALDRSGLNSLQGFRRGFWDAMLSESISPSKRSTAVEKPKLILDIESKSLKLRMPSPLYTFNRNTGQFLTPLLVGLSSVRDLRDDYSGTIKGTSVTWNSHGWSGEGIALFDVKDGRFLGPRGIIAPGEYYLLAEPSQDLPDNVDVLIKFGNLVLLDKQDGPLIYKVAVTEKNRFLGNMVVSEIPSLEWNSEGRTLQFSTQDNVFVGELPKVNIKNPDLIRQGEMAVFFSAGKETLKIQDSGQLNAAIADLKSPVRGEVWIDVIGRSRLLQKVNRISELVFTLIPECDIRLDKQLYNYFERPDLCFKSPHKGYRFDGVKQGHTDEVYSLAEGVSSESIGLSIENINAPLLIPVPRIGLVLNGVKIYRYITAEDVKNNRLEAYGPPGKELKLVAENAPEAGLEIALDAQGKAQIENIAFEKAFLVSGTSPVQKLIFILEDWEIFSGTSIINIDCLKQQREDYTFDSEDNLTQIIEVCVGLTKEKIPKISISKLPDLPREFELWMFTIFACARVFDGTVITIGDKAFSWDDSAPQKVSESLDLYIGIKDGTVAFSELTDISSLWYPPGDRWKNEFTKVVAWYHPESRREQLASWSRVLKERGNHRNMLSGLPGGSQLSQAWSYYIRGELSLSNRFLNSVDDSSPVVHCLCKCLGMILVLRLGRFSAASALASEELLLPEYRWFCRVVESVCDLVLKGEKTDIAAKPDFDIIPLTSADTDLFRTVLSGKAKKHTEGDWLHHIVSLFLTRNAGKSFEALVPLIPQSPDRELVLANLALCVKGEIKDGSKG